MSIDLIHASIVAGGALAFGVWWGYNHGYRKGKQDNAITEVAYEITYPPKLDEPTKIMPDKPGVWRLRQDREWRPSRLYPGDSFAAPRPPGWQNWEVVEVEVIEHGGKLFCADDGRRVEARTDVGRWLGPAKAEMKA